MSYRAPKTKEVIRIILFMIFFAFTVAVNLNCSDDNPVKGPECGKGNNTWDVKTQICRDGTGQQVPKSCCGQ